MQDHSLLPFVREGNKTAVRLVRVYGYILRNYNCKHSWTYVFTDSTTDIIKEIIKMYVQPRQPVHLDKMMDGQNIVHNSLRIELEPIFQTFTIDGYKMGTNAYIIECIYLVILLLEMSV